MTTASGAGDGGPPSLRGYVLAETVVGGAINILMSLAFTWLVFHGHARVPTRGGLGLITDSLPQSFMVALMSVLPATLLTRARARRRRPLPRAPRNALSGPRNLAVRAITVAVGAAAAGFVAFSLLAPPLAPAGLTFPHALWLKAAYGALLSIVIIPFAAIAALKDAE